MFDTVLVANRGEIARRIIRTLQRMGIRAIAVHSEADSESTHVHEADGAVLIGPAPPAQSYLRAETILDAAIATGAQAVHPGYGFLSENATFAEMVEASGIAFIGPTPDQLRQFGLKHTSRELAEANGVPILAGSGLLRDVDEAVAAASTIGFPVMVKSTAGGGGIGMGLCRTTDELVGTFTSVRSLSSSNFSDGGVFLERYVDRARHIEVQIFGDGHGEVITLGDRDCSTQRRNQKVVEEAPAPGIPDAIRERLAESAVRLGRAVSYRSAGTVEYVYDDEREVASFLEVNTRLQVEHPVTEVITGIDLVEWMVRCAAGELPPLAEIRPEMQGHAMEARIYAEDPGADHRPSTGRIMEWRPPSGARVDDWVVPGTEVTPHYDPLLAKVIVSGPTRQNALERLQIALDEFRVSGIETNLEQLRSLSRSRSFSDVTHTTRTLDTLETDSTAIDVLDGGTLTTIQDHPGRTGYWRIGVPPSGPVDDRSFRLGNALLGNVTGAAGVEMTLRGPTLRFRTSTSICITGAAVAATLTPVGDDPLDVAMFAVIEVTAGSTLRIGEIGVPGCRAYLTVAGGIDGHHFLGSRSTFDLGGFGGHGGRPLLIGDVLHILEPGPTPGHHRSLPDPERPAMSSAWAVDVLLGPHSAPDFFTDGDLDEFLAADWQVHFNSNRTGIRLIGPTPTWARSDGGEAGLHPSNIHDTVYAIGAVDFTGDMPVVLGPDGPSLGGFVCPVTIASSDLWKMGQVRAGDTVRFRLIDHARALELETRFDALLDALRSSRTILPAPSSGAADPNPAALSPILGRLDSNGDAPSVTYRRSGDSNVLVEYGDNVLDLDLRMRAAALQDHLVDNPIDGVIELSPGIRSLQVRFDPRRIGPDAVVDTLAAIEELLPSLDKVSVPSRVVHLPLSWDDPATKLAIEKYDQIVRRDAPWAPSNIEFIRRINGLESVEDVQRIVLDSDYLVLGLGDVYLGAPVATPVDPRHRLVTTKYNPARTWTPENAVGIGGAYLCVYGMEGPGGYQFVGRTVPVWNQFRREDVGPPWALRLFDRLKFHLVSAEELLDLRRDMAAGRIEIETEPGTFSLREHHEFLERHHESIVVAKARQQNAFDAERRRWAETGQANFVTEFPPDELATDEALDDGLHGVPAPMHGSIWKVLVEPGDRIHEGDAVVVLEAMKMETRVSTLSSGTVVEIRCREGQEVKPGTILIVIEP